MPPGGRERRGLRGPQNGARRYVNRPEVCVPDNWVFDLGAGFCPDEFSGKDSPLVCCGCTLS